jgi:uncharacterized protein YbaR (Trm112 family)
VSYLHLPIPIPSNQLINLLSCPLTIKALRWSRNASIPFVLSVLINPKRPTVAIQELPWMRPHGALALEGSYELLGEQPQVVEPRSLRLE